MSTVFMFPGQGAQAIGMGADLFAGFESARNRFAQANEILGRDIAKICFEGPEDELKATQNTQPALFLVEAVAQDLLVDKGIVPTLTMGHSLGEYAALYAAGVFSFADGLRLVAKRGELMALAGKEKPGAMAAIIGLSKDQIAQVLATVTAGIVVCANENTPEQTVISGEVAAVNQACELLKAAGAKRALPLPVSGAFHSPLMQDAAHSFGEFLATVSFSAPRCGVITNVTASVETDPVLLKSLLTKQLVSSVRWVDSIRHLATHSVTRCFEVGPGNVVSGLAKKINPDLSISLCGKKEQIEAVK